ncbi:MAG: hypothetical protein ACTSSI_05840 [Candidatus Helarchaeota archaeon]
MPILNIFISEGETFENAIGKLKNPEMYENNNDVLEWIADQVMEKSESSAERNIVIPVSELPEPIFYPDISLMESHPDQLKPILELIGFKTTEENEVRIMTRQALFSISLETADVFVTPLICEYCSKKCKKKSSQYLCIVPAGIGWTNIAQLSQKDFLILSKIYALSSPSLEDLPKDVLSQLKHLLTCKNFQPIDKNTPKLLFEKLNQISLNTLID